MELVPRKMHVHFVDQHGNQIRPDEEVAVPAPEQVSADGLAHIEGYVARLAGSEAAFVSLIVSTLDGQGGFLLWRRGDFGLTFHVDVRQPGEQEPTIRVFFAGRNIALTQEYLSSNGGIPDAIRHLTYLCGDDAEYVAALCRSLLKEVYGVSDTEGLTFLFQEH